MDTQIETTVEDVVSDMLVNGFMFTAFDVTKKVRETLGKGTFVSHSDVNRLVQEKLANGDLDPYVRDMITISIDGVDVRPWIYHSPASPANVYDPLWMENNPTQIGMKSDMTKPYPTVYIPSVFNVGGSSAISDCTTTVGVSDDGVDTVKVTSEKRLNIPLKIVEDCGLTPNELISVSIDNNEIKVSKGILSSYSHVIQVNRDGRIRLGNSILNKIASSNVTEFKVRSENNEIFVEAV
jgi:hypothetical protein